MRKTFRVLTEVTVEIPSSFSYDSEALADDLRETVYELIGDNVPAEIVVMNVSAHGVCRE